MIVLIAVVIVFIIGLWVLSAPPRVHRPKIDRHRAVARTARAGTSPGRRDRIVPLVGPVTPCPQSSRSGSQS